MYIRSIYKQVEEIKDVSFYRKQLKEISKINLRQSSKLNILAVIGALKCAQNVSYDKNLAIYLASEYSCTHNMLSVITQVNTKDDIVMPFDFLNINTNNVGFFISEALGTLGNSLNVASQDLSFEKAFELAYFDLSQGAIMEALVGGADESLEDVINDYKLVHNLYSQKIKDGTSWMLISNSKEGSFAEVKDYLFFANIEKLNQALKAINCDRISLNQYAKKYKNDLAINQNLIIEQKDEFFGTGSAGYIADLLSYSGNLIHISIDERKRAYLFLFERN